MKRILSIVIALSLLLCLGGCGKEKSKPSRETEPLAGTWEAEAGSVTFEGEGKNLSGTWQGRSFQITDRTDFTLTFRLENGRLQTVSYAVFGDTLCLDGVIYTCPGKHVPISRELREKTWVVDDKIMPVIHNLYMGMTREEVETILGEELSYWTQESDSDKYQGKAGDGIYRFDAQLRLIYTQKEIFDPETGAAFYEEMLKTCTELFGQPASHKAGPTVGDNAYSEVWHSWDAGGYSVILTQVCDAATGSHCWTLFTIAK